MTYYLISFPSNAMDVTEAELPDVSASARAVVREAMAAGVYVFSGGINADVGPVIVAADGSITEGTYPETEQLEGGYAVLDLASREEAVTWAARFASGCRCGQELREFMYDPDSVPHD